MWGRKVTSNNGHGAGPKAGLRWLKGKFYGPTTHEGIYHLRTIVANQPKVGSLHLDAAHSDRWKATTVADAHEVRYRAQELLLTKVNRIRQDDKTGSCTTRKCEHLRRPEP